jgi:hypothetical protein
VLCEVLKLVRPCSYVLALGLGLVASEVCTPLNPKVFARIMLVLGGACSLERPHQPRLWCGCHCVPKGIRPVTFQRKLDSEDDGEWSRRGLAEGTLETHLRVGKAQGYPRSYPTGSLALARDSLQGAPTRTREKLECFSISR